MRTGIGGSMRRREAVEEGERRAEKAMQEHVTRNAAVNVRTARLRALRQAKEAEAGPVASKPRPKKRASVSRPLTWR